MAKLTNPGRPKERLTDKLNAPFSLCFKYRLANGYTFSELSVQQLREWQNFLDLAAQMTFQDVERRYRRNSDKKDEFQGEQVIHYGIGKVFRIHGVIENGQFVVLRMDPDHKFHR